MQSNSAVQNIILRKYYIVCGMRRRRHDFYQAVAGVLLYHAGAAAKITDVMNIAISSIAAPIEYRAKAEILIMAKWHNEHPVTFQAMPEDFIAFSISPSRRRR